MDLWTFQRFQQPRLSLDAIDYEESSKVVVLRAGEQTYRLAFDDSDAAAQIAAELATLGDSEAPLWDVLRQSTPDTSWFTLGNFLDTHSLVCETKDYAAERLETQATAIQKCIDDTAAIIFQRVPENRRAMLADQAAFLRQTLNKTRDIRTSFDTGVDPFNAEEQPNFYLGLAAMEFEYFRRSSPLTLAAVEKLLARIAGDSYDRIDVKETAEFSEVSGVYDLWDLESHLWLIGHCLALSTSDEAARFPTPPIPVVSLSSGLEFMRQTELLTRTALSMWGPNRYVEALEELSDPGSPLIAGPYIEQYHVTRRFLEIIAPNLSKRLSIPLRQMMFRYFGEEFGHEALESATCEALGVTKHALDAMLPLPLHFAFVDVLTLAAHLDPITSFASVMVIEGVFGEPPRLSLRLASVGQGNPSLRSVSKEHDELNETLNHNSISRDAFENITAVAVSRQVIAMRRVLFLLELNHRAWDGIADFYGRQEVLCLQGPLGQPLNPQT